MGSTRSSIPTSRRSALPIVLEKFTSFTFACAIRTRRRSRCFRIAWRRACRLPVPSYRQAQRRPPGAAQAANREDSPRAIHQVPEAHELGLQIADRVVRGRIEWDEDRDGSVPVLVIDGREVTWKSFGRMLMSFEGWQFQLKLLDKSEE
jgi:hypothetical protein